MSLAGIEPFTIGEALWEDWIFECDCGKVEKRPKKLDPSAVALPVVTPAE